MVSLGAPSFAAAAMLKLIFFRLQYCGLWFSRALAWFRGQGCHEAVIWHTFGAMVGLQSFAGLIGLLLASISVIALLALIALVVVIGCTLRWLVNHMPPSPVPNGPSKEEFEAISRYVQEILSMHTRTMLLFVQSPRLVAFPVPGVELQRQGIGSLTLAVGLFLPDLRAASPIRIKSRYYARISIYPCVPLREPPANVSVLRLPPRALEAYNQPPPLL